jgi:hypothetical protein
VQQILSNNRQDLMKEGWVYPGSRLNQQQEIYHLCGPLIPWISEARQSRHTKIAERLLAEIRATHARIVLSSEALSSLNEHGIRHVLRKLGSPEKVVLTVRNLGRLVPSAWQQYIKSGGDMTLQDFVQNLRQTRGEDLRDYWRTYAYGQITKMWSCVSGSPVELVILPKQSARPQDLWYSFRAAAGLPEVVRTDVRPEKMNLSLSREMTELLRLYNQSSNAPEGRRQRKAKRREFIEKYIAPISILGYGRKIELTGEQRTLVRVWNDYESRLALEYSHRIHGDLNDLDED